MAARQPQKRQQHQSQQHQSQQHQSQQHQSQQHQSQQHQQRLGWYAVAGAVGCGTAVWRRLRRTRSARKAAEAVHWRHQALHDELTQLANRGGLFDSLELLVDPASEDGRACDVLYADLDGFKGINDTYGHAAGDAILVTMADRLRGLVRPGDTVARLGGDEFVLVIDRVSDTADALEIAERVRQALAAPGSSVVER